MNTRTNCLLIATLLLTAPLLSHAEADVGLDACVKAFISTSLEAQRPFTIKQREGVVRPIAEYRRTSRIFVKAVGVHSGEQIAEATCIVNRDGVVLSLDGEPIAPSAILSSR